MFLTVECKRLEPVGNSEEMPAGRSGHRIVCIDDEIYVIGGYAQLPTGLEVAGEIWVYNILANRWRRLNLQSSPFHLALSASAVAIGKRIFIHGGTGIPFAHEINNTVIEVDVVTGECKEHPCLPKDGIESNIPEATYGHSLTYVLLSDCQSEIDGGMLIKVGGTPYSNTISAFSFATGTWEKLSGGTDNESFETFTPRYRHDAVFWRDELYIIGGTKLDGSLPFWPMPVFNIKQRSFRYINFDGECPAPIEYPCSVHFDNLIFTTGGFSEPQELLNLDIYAFDLEKLTFGVAGIQECPTFFHDLTVVPDRNQFYSFGGVRNGKRVNHLYRLQIMNKPVSLKELSWLRVADLLRTFYPPELTPDRLQTLIRTAAAPLLGLSTTSNVSKFQSNDNRYSFTASFQGVLAISKSFFSYLVGKGSVKNPKLSAQRLNSSSSDTFFEYMMSVTATIIDSIEVERKVDVVESVTIFLTVLFYCNGAPLKYIERLPYGTRCLIIVSRYMEKMFGEASSEEDDSEKVPN